MIVLFPDAVDVVVGYLQTFVGFPVGHDVPDPRPDEFVTVVRGGGVRQTVVSDNPTLLFECWGPTPEAAMDVAQLIRAYVNALPYERVVDGVPVYRVNEVAGPADLPDPVSNQPRVVFTTQVHLRGATAVGS